MALLRALTILLVPTLGGSQEASCLEGHDRHRSCPATGSSLIQLKPELSRIEAEQEQEDHEDIGVAGGYKPVAIQRRMPAAAGLMRHDSLVECAHERHGLRSFSEVLLSPNSDVTLPTATYLLDANATVKGLTIPAGAELIFADRAGLTLTASAIHVLGKLTVGSEGCPLRNAGVTITLTGSGDRLARSSDPLRTKGIIVGSTGVLHLFGIRYMPTWTRLAATAAAGSTWLELEDEVDWQVGQQVVVVTTAWTDAPGNHQNELRRLTAVAGRRITLDRALDHGHYGGPEYSAEVALLSRSVTLQGDEGSEETRYGGHLLCSQGSQCRIGGVAAVRMGQENGMGRYPFHLHLMGNVSGDSYFEDNLVHRSYFRAFTLHGTSSARVSRNVAYDVSGSAYYLEDGVEEENLFDFNLAAFVHIIDQLADYDGGGGQEGVTVASESAPGRIVPTDATAVGFYCTNARNRWIGNSASGGFSGFHFPTVPNALGESYQANPTFAPDSRELLEFDSNTAHSSGRLWVQGACMYVGGKLWEDSKGSHQYRYQTGRAQPPRKSGRFIFTNTKVFACKKGMLFWGTHYTSRKPELALEHFEAHDVSRSSSQLGETYIFHAIISAQTGNTMATDLPKVADGFELYDTDMQTVLSDVLFRNFNRNRDVAIMDMTHSNKFKPQGMFTSKGLRFENTPRAQRFRHNHRLACQTYHQDTCQYNCQACPGTAGSSQIANIMDDDGSALGWDLGGAILGADDTSDETAGRTNDWWRLDDSCVHEAGWGFWACPSLGRRSVVSLFIMRGVMDTSAPRTSPNTAVGQLYHFGHMDRHLDVGLGESPQVTGPCCDIGWFLALDGGAVEGLTIFVDQMVTQGGLVFATAYPLGAQFTVQRCLTACMDVSQGSSLQEVLDAPGSVYFVDRQGRLYLKLLHETNTYFSAGGVSQLHNGNRWLAGRGARYTIRSSLAGSVGMLLPDPLQGVNTGPTQPATTSTQPPPTTTDPSCKDQWETCTSEKCCNGGHRCYEKNTYWAQCMPGCTPGINPNDLPEYQTPWSCRILTRDTTTLTTTTTTSSTTAPVERLFVPVDGGSGRACRGARATDNSDSYYRLISGVTSIEVCQQHCRAEPSCRGIEFGPGRCEVWLRPGGIGASIPLQGYTCQRFLHPRRGSYEVVGGPNSACRGSSPQDNSPNYYVLQSLQNASSLAECEMLCSAMQGCRGVEHSPTRGRCELWTREIGAAASVSGFSCRRFREAS